MTNDLALKRNISDSYTKTEVDTRVNAPQVRVYTSAVEFQDVLNLGIDTLTVKGGTNTQITDDLSNVLIDGSNSIVEVHPPFKTYSTITSVGNLTAPNI